MNETSKTEPQFVGCTGAILKPFMDTRKDYGPQGCAHGCGKRGMQALGIFGLSALLVLKIRRTR